jgi:2-polyprenyl-3-methyl-5-hydroxy-6-metoxy-1,4-benzoquinol methylase
MSVSKDYMLAQGEADVDRLALINQLYGPSSEALLREAGLTPGLRVVEVGCGSGNMTCWLAEQVGPKGRVTGVDVSPDSLEQARKHVQRRGLRNVDFHCSDVNHLALPKASFDLTYCRCVLMHLRQAEIGLRQMADLVRPDGSVVCEELDLSRCFFEPPCPFVTRMMELNVILGDHRSVQYRLGSRMNTLFQKAGFHDFKISFFTPAVMHGPAKHLLTRSFREMAGRIVEFGLATKAECDEIIREASRTDADATTLYGMPLMGQAWAKV